MLASLAVLVAAFWIPEKKVDHLARLTFRDVLFYACGSIGFSGLLAGRLAGLHLKQNQSDRLKKARHVFILGFMFLFAVSVAPPAIATVLAKGDSWESSCQFALFVVVLLSGEIWKWGKQRVKSHS